MGIHRAEGSSKIQSRLEQQTSRLSQQMKSSSSSTNKTSSSSKSSPPKEKASPPSPMDDIERGNVSGTTSSNCSFSEDLKPSHMLLESIYLLFFLSLCVLARCKSLYFPTELMAEARVMDQLNSSNSSSDSNSSSSSSSDDSSSSSESEEEQSSAPTNQSMPVINTSVTNRHQDSGGLMNTLSE